MKTEDIKTWRETKNTSDVEMNTEDWMEDEIDDLRAALKERDAEIGELKMVAAAGRKYVEENSTQRAVMQQALDVMSRLRYDNNSAIAEEKFHEAAYALHKALQ